MSIQELEAEALKLDPKARARLAGKLLASLENLSEEENTRLWVEEAERRAVEMDTQPDSSTSAKDVFREARAKLQ
ncbi:MAG: addiction module protein [Nitrospira sp.]|nr:addiction module protein [Nitrospira sp.]MDH4369181.1 addiction module protein [Nitrospira sp.]MDH5348638.1 addiction module protein [Nitrospira sp.]MDH5498432.1 addiction module protein [Nitrospira sp.]